MADAEEGSSGIVDELFSADDKCDDVYIDLDSFWRLMGPASPLQGDMLEDLSSIDVPQGVQNSKDTLSPKVEIPGSSVLSPSHYSQASDSRTGNSDCFSESVGTSSVIVGGSQTPSYFPDYSGQAPSGTPNHSGPLHSYGTSHVTYDGESSILCHTNHDQDRFGSSTPDFQFKNTEDASVIDVDEISQDASHTESSSCEINTADIPGSFPGNGGMYLFGSDDPPYFSFSSVFQPVACDGGRMVNTKDDVETIKEDSISVMPSMDLAGSQFGHHTPEYGTVGYVPLNGHCGFSYLNDMITVKDESKNPSPNSWSYIFSKTENDLKVDKKVESITSNEIVSKASEVVDDIISRKYSGVASKLTSTEGTQWSSSNSLSLIYCKNYVSSSKDEKENIFLPRDFLPPDMIGETNFPKLAIGGNDRRSDLLISGQPGKRPLASVKAGMNCQNMECEVSKFNNFYHSNITYQGIQSNKLDHNLDDDADVYILEDMSAPAVASKPGTLNGNLFATSRFSTLTDPVDQMVTENSRLIPNDERSIFRIAVEDLSQPKSETEPPDGALAVPLLKHQRIALSWMVNQETKGACCSGGILADDQGLGKTVSTIALILKERPPSSEAPTANMEQCKTEMCDLDEDNGASETCYVEEPCEINVGKTFLQRKGRPSAGTLVVCPTSVIRQWSEEFHNKVTMEADLSVLVYHGSSRTKDPLELAKYDVVITTYAIVSMEVRKQPAVDENDDQTGTYKGFSSSKKRKLLETASCKKSDRSKKSNKEVDSELLETISGPLAKVGWFRVVLDEAQTIKNHKTQVARACWGLRAKRRWCLSGTPIQNAIDDLYSYFRFLRHDPYATFRNFCEHIKLPIHKNPKVGYTKLQAVLKTILLRRTKGTCIDGEPIVNIPPKTIELKRVDFSVEEREFYCRLEADSRAQFAEYANAGTVKQNYVNILLLLLRLRQACGHPLLVRGFSSTSRITSSIEMAKKLPPEKIIFLLNCLEASLAICGICSDPPEDAVVTVCGHVFCNQCICDHMIGDEMQCPNKICKTRLTLSHIFSNTTLRGGISDHLNPSNNQTPSCSDSELAEVSEACSLNFPEGSSKIKAALKLLTSLSKPHVPTSTLSSLESIEECCGSDWLHVCDSAGEKRTSEIKNESRNPAEVMGEKAIVFSQWTRMLDLLEDYLKNSSIQFRRLDGTMPIAVRDKAVKEFNTLPEVSVMIMSLKAASLGLNMVAACHVILLDLWWNPTTEDQAIDRAHRIGQTRRVSVYRLTVRNTVEDRILALQEKKREMVASAFGEEEIGGRQARLTVDDLKYLFRAN